MSTLPTQSPVVNEESKPYWEAAARGELCLPRCDDCGFVIFYPRRRCPACRSESTTWTPLSGRGRVYSYTVTHRIPGRWREHAPFVLAYVELEEGPRMLTNIVDCEPGAVRVDMPVMVRFDRDESGNAVPRFAPA